jgi:hypothetical protein
MIGISTALVVMAFLIGRKLKTVERADGRRLEALG